MVEIATKISSLSLKNPTILASGVMDEDAGSMKRILKSGAGAVVTKSIGLKPKEGYKNPTIIELEHGILNAMGLPNPGIENFKDELLTLRKLNQPIIGSIYGSNSRDFMFLAKKMQEYKIDAVELNMSCPHAKGYGLEIGSDAKLVKEIVINTKKSVNVPVFVKLSPNLMDIVEIAKAAEEGKADALVAINTVKAMKIDIDLKKPVLSNKVGGYSGPAIKPIGVRCVYEISQNTNIPIIGCGGINSGKDAIEYMMAGANAVQIGSAVYYREVDIFKKICSEIKNWMEKHNYSDIKQIIGVAHK